MHVYSKSECQPGIADAYCTQPKQDINACCIDTASRKKSWPLVKEPQAILYHPRDDKFSIEKEADLQNCKISMLKLMRFDSDDSRRFSSHQRATTQVVQPCLHIPRSHTQVRVRCERENQQDWAGQELATQNRPKLHEPLYQHSIGHLTPART